MIQSKFRTLLRVIQSLWAYLRGKPINKANLSFGTVDWNDVKIAWKRLNQPDSWNDTEVIKTYEKAFSTFNDTLFSFSFLQGRVALSACLHALGLSRGDKIIVPAYTCVAVPNACWIHDLEPVFCDIELDTYGLSLDSLKAQISKYPEVKAIIVQH